MTHGSPSSRKRSRHAFTLIEILVAVAVVVVALVSIFALMAAGLGADRDVKDRMAAVQLYEGWMAQLSAKPFGDESDPEKGDRLYPLPSLNLAEDETSRQLSFSTDMDNRYVEDESGDAVRLVEVRISVPPALDDLALAAKPPEFRADKDRIVHVRVIISWPAASPAELRKTLEFNTAISRP